MYQGASGETFSLHSAAASFTPAGRRFVSGDTFLLPRLLAAPPGPRAGHRPYWRGHPPSCGCQPLPP
eukprot:3959491-Pyramimonas_sp.AAC.1